MQSEFVAVICQMGIFMICAQAIVHFRPKASYEKYLKMLVSAMMLIQMFLVVGGIFSENGKRELAERAQWFADSLEENTFFSEEEWEFQIVDDISIKSREEVLTEETQKIEVKIAPIESVQIGTVQ